MPSPNVSQLLAHPAVRAAITRALAARGVHGDTELIHADPREEAMLRMMGGVGTVNPRTGLRQFYEAKGASGGSASTGENDTGMGSDLGGGVGGALGRALGDIGDFADRAAGNFGSGWGSRGVAGGYGGAGNQSGAGYSGGGAGGGGLSGGHSGQNYYSQTYGGLPPPAGQIPQAAAPLPQAPVINNLPGPPVSLTPMMSSTAPDLAGGERFGALPSWATTPYQVGTAPSDYPTPGVNAGLGAPGFAGNPLPGQPGGAGLPGGGGAPGGGSGILGGGAPGGGGAPSGPLAGPYVGLANLAASGQGALANRLAPAPGSPQDYWAQMLASGQVAPSPALRAFYAATGGGLGAQPQSQIASGSPRNAQQPVQQQIHPAVAQALAQVAAPRPALPGPALGQVAAKPFANLAAKQKAAAARLAAAARTGGKNFG